MVHNSPVKVIKILKRFFECFLKKLNVFNYAIIFRVKKQCYGSGFARYCKVLRYIER